MPRNGSSKSAPTAAITGNPFVDTWLNWQSTCIDEGLANLRRASRIPGFVQKSAAPRRGVTPSEIVYEEDRLQLLHYHPPGPIRYRTPLVFVFALVNRPYILDLQPGKSVVSHFVERGFDTYLVDWGIPTDAERRLSLDDYVNGYMRNVVDFVRERAGTEQASILGYCMGGTMSAMFTALHQRLVKNLILLAAGIDFAPKDGLLNVWTDERYFDIDKFVDTFGNCPPQFLQASFLLLKPVQNLFEKPLGLWERLEDDAFLENYLAMEGWLNDNIPVPGEVFREFVKYLYQQNRLVKGTMPVGRHLVNLRDITCPVLNLIAAKDDLVPCAQSEPFNGLVSSTDKAIYELAAGHIGLAVGSKAQSELWPKTADWLAARSDPITGSGASKHARPSKGDTEA